MQVFSLGEKEPLILQINEGFIFLLQLLAHRRRSIYTDTNSFFIANKNSDTVLESLWGELIYTIAVMSQHSSETFSSLIFLSLHVAVLGVSTEASEALWQPRASLV